MTDLETAIMIKNMARETVNKMTVKNARSMFADEKAKDEKAKSQGRKMMYSEAAKQYGLLSIGELIDMGGVKGVSAKDFEVVIVGKDILSVKTGRRVGTI